MKFLKDNWVLALAVFLVVLLVKILEQEPKVITNTEIVYKSKIDTIVNVVIDEKVKLVYVDRLKTIKGKDSIVYKEKPRETTTTANQHTAKLVANNATANLKITTTGQLLDVSGTIEWQEKETVTNVIITKPRSGLFLYAETSVAPLFQKAEIGLDYQIKNCMIVGSSISFDNLSRQNYINLKLGFRIF